MSEKGTMTEMERIADQLKRAFEGEAWHGPAILELLKDVTAEQAAKRPIAGAHTIWEIVLHMTTWKNVLRRRLLGEIFRVTAEEDWPSVGRTDDAEWQAAIARLKSTHDQLSRVVASLDEARLDEPLVKDGSRGYIQLHGIVQHDLYHGGQIAVLKKG